MEPTSGMILGGVALGVVAALVYTVRSMIVICLPNEMVVVSGRKRTTSDGRQVGYRVLHGGRTLRIAIVEKVSRIDLTTIPIEVMVKNAYSKGGIPLVVQGIANVKVSAREPVSYNAVERLLGARWGVEVEFARGATLENDVNQDCSCG